LKAVTDRLAELEENFNAAVTEKEALAAKVIKCEVQLSNAGKLVGGLGGEETRWKASVAKLSEDYTNLIGDVLISAGTISYLGPFTSDFRNDMVEQWKETLKEWKIPHSMNCDIEQTLAVPVDVQQWQVCGLATDSVSTQNGIIMAKARRWPLLIDPQSQANRFVKKLGKISAEGLDVVKLSNKNFLRTLENGVRFGKWVLLENIQEELDAALEPILLQQKFKQSGQDMIKLGDNTVPYNDSFKFFMSTKLPNPHYAPETCVKVTLLNFAITTTGLEEQMLNVVVAEELPEQYEKKKRTYN
jgi:dynein heavy chain